MPESKNSHDKDNKLVTAMTIEDDNNEYDREPREITGKLLYTQSPFEEWPPQCFVDGIQVDPDTIKMADPEHAKDIK